jgi:hypothetical protein
LSADVAQLVEQRFRKAWVACSSQVIGLSTKPRCGEDFHLQLGFSLRCFFLMDELVTELRANVPDSFKNSLSAASHLSP